MTAPDNAGDGPPAEEWIFQICQLLSSSQSAKVFFASPASPPQMESAWSQSTLGWKFSIGAQADVSVRLVNQCTIPAEALNPAGNRTSGARGGLVQRRQRDRGL
ncbi:hypothetical protein [Kibdelosporangium philippinense]|uniref:hypothetical protein n=1 Tax=Kibdelosporangium philippinense TaxID=211113 RepID=UPI00362462C1